jgi:hypothetical protein
MPAVTATTAKYTLQVTSGTSAPAAQNRCGRLANGPSRRNSPSTASPARTAADTIAGRR